MQAGISIKTISTFLFWLLFLFSVALKSDAAFLYFDPSESEVYRGDTVSLNLRIDTDEGECINTVDGVIHYDKSIRAVDVSRGDSILSIWLEPPIIDEESNTISFAGGMPGGYCGRIPGDPKLSNVILKIILRSPGLTVGGESNPTVTISLDNDTQVLLHDGFGTNAKLNTQDAKIVLLDKVGSVLDNDWRDEVIDDDEKPSDFPITLTSDDTAFSGDYFIVFNALDKQSGIDHYEVFEEPFSEFWSFSWGRADAPWIRTDSPYVLEDQTLNSTIWVKAIDKAGNESVSKLIPDQALQTISNNKRVMYTFIGGLIIVLFGIVTYVLWSRKQKSIVDKEEDDE